MAAVEQWKATAELRLHTVEKSVSQMDSVIAYINQAKGIRIVVNWLGGLIGTIASCTLILEHFQKVLR